MDSDRRRIAYLVSRYPLVSHTFVQREVLGLRAQGWDLTTFSLRATSEGDHLTETDRAEAAATVVLAPPSLRAVWRGLLVPVLRHPRAVLATVAIACRGHWRSPLAVLWRFFYVAEALLLWRECEDRGIRRIHAHHGNVAADLAWLATEFGGRLESSDREWSWTFTLHGPMEFMAVREHDLDRKAAAARWVACISDFTRSQLMMHSDPAVWERFEVVHCGVDTERFVPAPRGHDRHGGPFTVLAIGRISPQKGYPVLLEAMARLRDRLDAPVRLVVGGEGPHRERLEETARSLGLDIDIRGAVSQDELLPLYRAADAFCLPSLMEGLPVVLMEAMACGVPVVTTDVAGIGELVEHERTGLLVRPGRADLVARELVRLATDPALRRRLAAAGRQRVVDEFDIRLAIDHLDRLFLEPGPR